jgi:RNA polymerase sigma-70 factor (ECF subfamily)
LKKSEIDETAGLAASSVFQERMKAPPANPDPPLAEDRQLVEMLEAAFARYQAELLGTLYYLVGNYEDARDALQDTFIKCWKHREQLPEVKNLRAWIFRIALNTGRDLRGSAWRRRRQPITGDEAMLATDGQSTETPLEQQEQLGRVRQAVSDLRPEEQEVFLLRQNGEMTYDQIAELVGIPTGTVKTRMRLALGKLRVALADR